MPGRWRGKTVSNNDDLVFDLGYTLYVESMKLGFKYRLVRSLFEQSIRTNKKQLKLTFNFTLNLRWNLHINVDFCMLRLSRCPGILPDYGHCSVMISKW